MKISKYIWKDLINEINDWEFVRNCKVPITLEIESIWVNKKTGKTTCAPWSYTNDIVKVE